MSGPVTTKLPQPFPSSMFYIVDDYTCENMFFQLLFMRGGGGDRGIEGKDLRGGGGGGQKETMGVCVRVCVSF